MNERSVDFIERGFENYCEARRVIAEFEAQIQQSASKALSEHLTSLSEAIGKPFPGNRLTEYSNADAPQFTWAWVAVYLACQRPLAWLYVGIRWELDAGGGQKAYAAVDFDVGTAPIRDRLLTTAAKVVPPLRFNLKQDYRNEVLRSWRFVWLLSMRLLS
jgi:hypothetical protein